MNDSHPSFTSDALEGNAEPLMMPAFEWEVDLMNARSRALASAIAATLVATAAHATELTAFALMPANTFATGPTSGQFAGPGAGGNPLPLIDKQPVQGISAVLHGPTTRSFYV